MPQRNPRRLDADELWQFALRTLGGRAYSIAELRDKLRRRAERTEDVAAVLARLKQHGYLDDRRFAETFAAARRDNQGLGRARVLRELRSRRVAPELAERAVREAYRDVDDTELIRNFLARRYRNVPLSELLAEPRNLAAVYRRLRLAGFPGGAILAVLRRYARQPEHLEALEALEPEDSPEF